MTELQTTAEHTSDDATSHPHLQGVDAVLARALNRPQYLLVVIIAAMVAIGWFWLALMAAGINSVTPAANFGPGTAIIQQVIAFIAPQLAVSPEFLYWLAAICTPVISGLLTLSGFLVVFSMWLAMAIAMMLPSAAPMLRTYADIANVAREKSQSVAPLWMLAVGYLSIWAVFALVAALLQLVLINFNLISATGTTGVGVISGLILMGAGLYQFSSLKHACLEKCRNPFTTLFANWSSKRSGVFKLGVEQGVFCLGCCWAIMLVMFVVGTMNLVWMVALTGFAILEKSAHGKVTTPIFGFILLAWGGILFLIPLI